jgi:hypothetical protein
MPTKATTNQVSGMTFYAIIDFEVAAGQRPTVASAEMQPGQAARKKQKYAAYRRQGSHRLR